MYNFRHFIFLYFIFCALPLWAKTKYELSLCAIFQDEGKYLKEWIEYHQLIGVEHFYLYNNNSQDDYKKVLKPYIKKKIVEVIDWPSPETEDWTPYQIKAYNDCIKRRKKETHWLAIIDTDEYIVPMTTDHLPTLLKNYEKEGGLKIFWQFFGTSWIKSIPNDKTLIESLTLKASQNHPWNYNCKSICQPARVKEYFVHGAKYLDPWHSIFPHGARGGAVQPIHLDIVRIHHYWTRDEDFFINVKVPRRERCEGNPFSEERIQQFYQEFNQVQDTSILRFVPELRKRLGL